MEGQRLILISGTYGADGSQYPTEIEGFSEILAHGAAGNGPAWFEVHTKAGQIMDFGDTTDSRILAQGKTTARAWAVNMISDTVGNYLTVKYQNDSTNGQAYPLEIDYTGNAGASLSPYNKVTFAYAARGDITPIYQAGSLIQTTVLLTDIKTFAGSSEIADYKFAYSAGFGDRAQHADQHPAVRQPADADLPPGHDLRLARLGLANGDEREQPGRHEREFAVPGQGDPRRLQRRRHYRCGAERDLSGAVRFLSGHRQPGDAIHILGIQSQVLSVVQ
ncbi:MAG: hypothetical protein ACYC8V_11625 [Caulobacteraceae bacterium]